MASSSKQISGGLFLLITIFSSIHARDTQFFNKNPSTTVPDNTLPEQNQPDFIPDNENAYGLYGHESGTDSDQPPRKYLPKNYNPVAYVTEPEDIDDNSVSFTENQKTYATNPTNYFNGQKDQDESAYKSYPTTAGGNNYYYNGGSSFNSDPDRFNQNYFYNGAGADGYQPEGLKDTKLFGTRENNLDNGAGADGYQTEGLTDMEMLTSRGNYYDAGAGVNGYQPQGMSDTRALEKGKYFYDVNSEKYSTDHPYERLRGSRQTYGGGREVNGEFP